MIVLILLFLAACGTQEISPMYDISSYKDLDVFLQNKRELLVNRMSEVFPDSDLSSVEIYVLEKTTFNNISTQDNAIGFYNRSRNHIGLLYIDGENCKTLAHELLHASLYQTTGDGDSDHSDPRFDDKQLQQWCVE